ncbi:MAG: DUF4124 domain-containing protein [Deltaproteobacteria bacterium]|nr:DUF4124 domain-containing protein [Deltaproteobacteria bacterium]
MSKVGLRLIGAVFICLLFAAGLSRAEIYKWVDKDGTSHFTDDPYELPEPQRSNVLRKIREEESKKQEELRKAGKMPAPVFKKKPRRYPQHDPIPPAPKKPASGEAISNPSSKKFWRDKMQKARKLVADLEQKCKKHENDRDQNRRAGLIFAQPAARQKVQEASAALEKCKEKLKEAKHDLNIDLPEKARRKNIPPGWLD